MATTKPTFLNETYAGYHHNQVPKEDEELTRVGPGTPGGEYLRRFWHPVAYTQELTDLPLAIKILGEELVIFRDGSGEIGLLERHCSHRGTSLEYGKIEQKGIRCCYHGWLFNVDGRILDTPGEPPDSTFKDKLCHGAYPVHEKMGIVFAYMGPPDKKPPFPNYDMFDMPESRLVAVPSQKNIKPCNWMQVVDNVPDIVHEAFLHGSISGVHFIDSEGRQITELLDVGALNFEQTPIGVLAQETRRVGDSVWVRSLEYICPNIANLSKTPTFPVKYKDGKEAICAVPKTFRWRVPVDDYNTMEINFYRAREADEDDMPNYGPATVSNMSGRPYADMQREPGDYEAQISQRPIAVHAMEHLTATDRGVTLFRKMVREGIRAVERGEDPVGVWRDTSSPIPTYGNEIVMSVPQAATTEEDAKLVADTGRQVGKRALKISPATDDIREIRW